MGRKHPRVETVVDYLTTSNLKGEIVKTRYLTEQTLLGQRIGDSDVCEVTIARGREIKGTK